MANPADLRAKHAAATKEVQHYLARQEFEMAVLAITPLLADLWEAAKDIRVNPNSLFQPSHYAVSKEAVEHLRQALKALEEHE